MQERKLSLNLRVRLLETNLTGEESTFSSTQIRFKTTTSTLGLKKEKTGIPQQMPITTTTTWVKFRYKTCLTRRPSCASKKKMKRSLSA